MGRQDWINGELNRYLNSETTRKEGLFIRFKNNFNRKDIEEDLNIEMTPEAGVVVVENDLSLYSKLKNYLTNVFSSKKEETEIEEEDYILKEENLLEEESFKE